MTKTQRDLPAANAAYTTLLSSQFQAFCRDLHTEAAQHLAGAIPQTIQPMFLLAFTSSRKLDMGNPNAGNIGSDFNRLGIEFWPAVQSHGQFAPSQRTSLDGCMLWRNAFAHQDFTRDELAGRSAVRLAEVRNWRFALEKLASIFDEVIRAHLQDVLGQSPW